MMDAKTEPASGLADVAGIHHSPGLVAQQIAAQQAAARRHVVVLLGAGASCAAGVPDLRGLQTSVISRLGEGSKVIGSMFESGLNLEEVLTRLRRLALVLGLHGQLDGLTGKDAEQLERDVTHAIIESITSAPIHDDVFQGLALWALRQDRPQPVELFTLNYDLLLEKALESVGAAYFDGFVGALQAPFHVELVEPGDSGASVMSPSFVRLWKLHGSINWLRDTTRESPCILRTGVPVEGGKIAAIYPSEEKYMASRRVPFLVLHDRLRRSLNEPETLLLVSGYSFGDDHVSEIIFDAASRRPRSTTMVFCFDAIPPVLAEHARSTPNLLVVSPELGIIGSRTGPWSPGPDIPGVYEATKMVLGDFGKLSRYLATLGQAGFDVDI